MAEDVSPSLREAIEAAVTADEAAASPAQTAEAPAETTAPERDEAGRFKAKESEAAPEEPDDYDDAVGLDRETWKLTPAQARERTKALAKEAREASERAKAYEPLDRVLAPRRDALRATWGDEGKAVEQLFHLSDWANRDFPGFVRHLAEQRGVDLRGLVPQGEPAQPQAPNVDHLIAERVERVLQERETARALADFERNDAFEFRNDGEVRRVMAGLLQSGAAPDLPTAYSMAVKAHPTISAKLAERESAERAKREADERARRDRERASAAVSVRGAPGTAAPASQPPPSNVREAVIRAMEAAGGRI